MRTIPLRIIRACQSLRPVLRTANRTAGNSQGDNGLAMAKQEHTPRRSRLAAMTYDPARQRLCRRRIRSGIDLAHQWSYAEQGLHGRVRHEVARMEYGAGERSRDQPGIREGVVDLRIGRGGSPPAGTCTVGVGASAGEPTPRAAWCSERSPAPYRSDASRASARIRSGCIWPWVSGTHSFTFRSFVPEWHERSNRS